MTVSVCPVAVIDAPLERVWDFLSVPAYYGQWWDAETRGIEPEGPAQPGQVIHALKREVFSRRKVYNIYKISMGAFLVCR